MALADCPDCGTPISTEAFVCPKCGRPTGKHKTVASKKMKRMVVLWAVLIVAFLVIWQLFGSAPPK